MLQGRKKEGRKRNKTSGYFIGILMALTVTILLFHFRPRYWNVFLEDTNRYPTITFYGVIQEEYATDATGRQIFPSFFTDVKNGDILVTDSTFCLCYRHGHAALVVDAAKGLVLESYGIGTESEFGRLTDWERYPHVLVLRLKASDEARESVAAYARKVLVGIPYRLGAGMVGDKDMNGRFWGTQCAHIVWAAYERMGYDVDGDGGWLVTPSDFLESGWLEVVPQ